MLIDSVPLGLILQFLQLNEIFWKISRLSLEFRSQILQLERSGSPIEPWIQSADDNSNFDLKFIENIVIEVNARNFCAHLIDERILGRFLMKCENTKAIKIFLQGDSNEIRSGVLTDILSSRYLRVSQPPFLSKLKSLNLQMSTSTFYRNRSNIEELQSNIIPHLNSKIFNELKLDVIDGLTVELIELISQQFAKGPSSNLKSLSLNFDKVPNSNVLLHKDLSASIPSLEKLKLKQKPREYNPKESTNLTKFPFTLSKNLIHFKLDLPNITLSPVLIKKLLTIPQNQGQDSQVYSRFQTLGLPSLILKQKKQLFEQFLPSLKSLKKFYLYHSNHIPNLSLEDFKDLATAIVKLVKLSDPLTKPSLECFGLFQRGCSQMSSQVNPDLSGDQKVEMQLFMQYYLLLVRTMFSENNNLESICIDPTCCNSRNFYLSPQYQEVLGDNISNFLTSSSTLDKFKTGQFMLNRIKLSTLIQSKELSFESVLGAKSDEKLMVNPLNLWIVTTLMQQKVGLGCTIKFQRSSQNKERLVELFRELIVAKDLEHQERSNYILSESLSSSQIQPRNAVNIYDQENLSGFWKVSQILCQFNFSLFLSEDGETLQFNSYQLRGEKPLLNDISQINSKLKQEFNIQQEIFTKFNQFCHSKLVSCSNLIFSSQGNRAFFEFTSFIKLTQNTLQTMVIDIHLLQSLCFDCQNGSHQIEQKCQLLNHTIQSSFKTQGLKYLIIEEMAEEVREVTEYCPMFKAEVVSSFLSSSAHTLMRVCLDLEVFSKEMKKGLIRQQKLFLGYILNVKKLYSLQMTRKTTESLDNCGPTFFLRILSMDTLRTVFIDGLKCFTKSKEDEEYKVDPLSETQSLGFSLNLQKIVLRLNCQTKAQYAHSVKWIMNQLKGLKLIEVLDIKSSILDIFDQDLDKVCPGGRIKIQQAKIKDFFEMQNNSSGDTYQSDQVDKEFISLSDHILKNGCARSDNQETGFLIHFSVVYPVKSKYHKVYSSHSSSTIINTCNKFQSQSNDQTPFKMFNSLDIVHAWLYFFRLTKLIKIDLDGKSRMTALQIMDIFNYTIGETFSCKDDSDESFTYRYFDNYRFGGLCVSDTFSEVHFSVLSQIIKTTLESNHSDICIQFDKNQQPIQIHRILHDLMVAARGGDLKIIRFLAVTLNLQESVILQSDVSLVMQIVEMKQIFEQVIVLNLERIMLYENDVIQLHQAFQNCTVLKIREVSFKKAKFESCHKNDYGEIQSMNISFLFLASELETVKFSNSNILEVITDNEVAALCAKIKEKDLKYLGLAGICPGIANCRKYVKILESIGSGFKGNNPIRVEKIDVSYNLFQGYTLTKFVLPFVKFAKMKQKNCYKSFLQWCSKPNFRIIGDVNIPLEPTEALEISNEFKQIVDFIMDYKNENLETIQFHKKHKLSLRGKLYVGTKSDFWFNTNCVCEFVMNMNISKRSQMISDELELAIADLNDSQSDRNSTNASSSFQINQEVKYNFVPLLKFEIQNFDLQSLGQSDIFSDLMTKALLSKELNSLVYLGIINCNLSKAIDHTQFLTSLLKFCTNLKEFRVSKNNLTFENIKNILEQFFDNEFQGEVKQTTFNFSNQLKKWPLQSTYYTKLETLLKDDIEIITNSLVDKSKDIIKIWYKSV